MNGGVCIRRSCLAKASLLHQVPSPLQPQFQTPALLGTPWQSLCSPQPAPSGCDEGRYLLRAWQPPVKLLHGATGAHWVLGHLWVLPPSIILGNSRENVVTGNPAAKALEVAKALGM